MTNSKRGSSKASWGRAGRRPDDLVEPARRMVHYCILSGGITGGRIAVSRGAKCHPIDTARDAGQFRANIEYRLKRYGDGILTLAELLRNPDISTGV